MTNKHILDVDCEIVRVTLTVLAVTVIGQFGKIARILNADPSGEQNPFPLIFMTS